jgi:Leucine-rich repeat (LRR) protein
MENKKNIPLLSTRNFQLPIFSIGIPSYNFQFCFLLLLLSLTSKFSTAQLLDSLSLDTMRGFQSIAEANKAPDKVIKLVIHHTKFAGVVPEDIKNYTNLQYLDLSKNHLKSLPSWIGDLKSLQMLILSKNSIDTLPATIGKLHNLKYFIMNRSSLNSIPPEIGELKQLIYLDLWGGNIDDFPIDLNKLTNLRVLDLRDILISDEEQALIKSYLPHAIVYFSPACQCKD